MKIKLFNTFTLERTYPWKFNPKDSTFVGYVTIALIALNGRVAVWNPKDLPSVMG